MRSSPQERKAELGRYLLQVLELELRDDEDCAHDIVSFLVDKAAELGLGFVVDGEFVRGLSGLRVRRERRED